MMVIPRENKYVRLYIQVTETDEDGKAVRYAPDQKPPLSLPSLMDATD